MAYLDLELELGYKYQERLQALKPSLPTRHHSSLVLQLTPEGLEMPTILHLPFLPSFSLLSLEFFATLKQNRLKWLHTNLVYFSKNLDSRLLWLLILLCKFFTQQWYSTCRSSLQEP
jgi:hypothetical protein